MLVAVFLCCLGFATVGGTLTNCIAWPKYVTPNETTACTCSYSSTGVGTSWYILWEDPDGEVVSRTNEHWDRRTQTLDLSLADIKKEDDGRNFSCYHVEGVQRTLLDTYIPFLAYGPDDVTITSTQTIRHDDTEKMVTTLTCSASVKPTAKFQWQGQPTGAVALPGCSCDNYTSSETLTFDSDLYQGGEVIKCTVANTGEYWPNSVEKYITLTSRPESSSSDHETVIGLGVALGVVVFIIIALVYRRIKQCLSNLINEGPVAVNNGGGGPAAVNNGGGGPVAVNIGGAGAVAGPSGSGGAVAGPSGSAGAVAGPSGSAGAVAGPSGSGSRVAMNNSDGGNDNNDENDETHAKQPLLGTEPGVKYRSM